MGERSPAGSRERRRVMPGGLLISPPKFLSAGWEGYTHDRLPSNDPSNFTVCVVAGTPDALSSNAYATQERCRGGWPR